MEDSSLFLNDRDGLLSVLNEKGFLYLKNVLDRNEVLSARSTVLQHLADKENLLPGTSVDEGVLKAGCGVGCVPMMEGKNSITHSESILKVIQSEALYKLFEVIKIGANNFEVA